MFDAPINPSHSSEHIVEKFVVRFPKGMRNRVHQVSNRARRSMNKEIVARLEHSLANFLTVPGEIPEPVNGQSEDMFLEPELSTLDEHEKAYTELLLAEQIQRKVATLSFERKLALFKLL